MMRKSEIRIKIILSALLLLVITGIAYNFRVALIGVSTILGTTIMITNCVDLYLFLKENHFNVKSITTINWKYFSVSTIIIGLIYIFLLPKKMIMVSGIIILCILGVLFVFDMVKSIFKI